MFLFRYIPDSHYHLLFLAETHSLSPVAGDSEYYLGK